MDWNRGLSGIWKQYTIPRELYLLVENKCHYFLWKQYVLLSTAGETFVLNSCVLDQPKWPIGSIVTPNVKLWWICLPVTWWEKKNKMSRKSFIGVWNYILCIFFGPPNSMLSMSNWAALIQSTPLSTTLTSNLVKPSECFKGHKSRHLSREFLSCLESFLWTKGILILHPNLHTETYWQRRIRILVTIGTTKLI